MPRLKAESRTGSAPFGAPALSELSSRPFGSRCCELAVGSTSVGDRGASSALAATSGSSGTGGPRRPQPSSSRAPDKAAANKAVLRMKWQVKSPNSRISGAFGATIADRPAKRAEQDKNILAVIRSRRGRDDAPSSLLAGARCRERFRHSSHGCAPISRRQELRRPQS